MNTQELEKMSIENFLLYFRNQLVVHLQTHTQLWTLMTNNSFQAILDRLDPALKGHCTTKEDALDEFDKAVNMIYEAMGVRRPSKN